MGRARAAHGLAAVAAAADVVVNATPGRSSVGLLTPLAAELAGTVLVDVANAVEQGSARSRRRRLGVSRRWGPSPPCRWAALVTHATALDLDRVDRRTSQD